MKNYLSARTRNKSSPRKVSDEEDGVDSNLLELVRLRVAQIHQCPVSIENHMEELRAKGETNNRLDQVATWGTSSLFDENERAALALCEKITVDPASPLLDCLIQEMRHYFTKAQIVSLTLAIIAVNDWNFLEIIAPK